MRLCEIQSPVGSSPIPPDQLAELHRLHAEMEAVFDAAEEAGRKVDNQELYPMLDAEAAIMTPLLAGIESASDEDLHALIAVLPPGFYRSELMTMLNKRQEVREQE